MLTIITALFIFLGYALIILLFLKLKTYQSICKLHYEEYRRKHALKNIKGLMFFFGFDMSTISDDVLQKAVESLSEKIKTTGVDATEFAHKLIELNNAMGLNFNATVKNNQIIEITGVQEASILDPEAKSR